MRPWTLSPTIWSATLPSIASWRSLMRDDGDRGSAEAQQKASTQIQMQCFPDVRCVQNFAAGLLVGPGFLGRHALVGARPIEREAERTGQRRFRPAGIGRAMT